MLDSLKFVQGAVAKKDFVPALTHFKIENGMIKGFNGKLALCCPIDLDLNISPRAIPFVKAVQTCQKETAIHITNAGKLAIKSGTFRAYIDCIQEEYPDVQPEGEMIELTDSFLPALKRVAPFVANDASRPWATGILFKGASAYATNNIIALQYWLGYDFPRDINIPSNAIKELLRIGEEPTHLQVSETSVTFHFGENKWLRSNLLDTSWPDMDRVLDQSCDMVEMPKEFFERVEDLKPFMDSLSRVFMLGNRLATGENEDCEASQESPIPLPERACFPLDHLLLLSDVADTVGFANYPKPCPFIGENLRGVIVGIRI